MNLAGRNIVEMTSNTYNLPTQKNIDIIKEARCWLPLVKMQNQGIVVVGIEQMLGRKSGMNPRVWDVKDDTNCFGRLSWRSPGESSVEF